MTGDDLRQLQRELKLTNTQFCRTLGVSEVTLCSWKAGRARIPNPAALALAMLAHYRDDLAKWVK